MFRSMFSYWCLYVLERNFKGGFLLCNRLETTTGAENELQIINDFFEGNCLDWDNLMAVRFLPMVHSPY